MTCTRRGLLRGLLTGLAGAAVPIAVASPAPTVLTALHPTCSSCMNQFREPDAFEPLSQWQVECCGHRSWVQFYALADTTGRS